jgi:hypothetical protein
VKPKSKINWDTVELVGELIPASIVPSRKRPVPLSVKSAKWPAPLDSSDPKTRSTPPDPRTKLILSGASAKARARGPSHTHTQLRKLIPEGIEMLIYSWWLVTAALESDRDLSRGVEVAAHAITATSQRYLRRT